MHSGRNGKAAASGSQDRRTSCQAALHSFECWTCHCETAKTTPDQREAVQAELKKKARLERFGGVQQAKSAEDSSALASKLAARAERFALAKPEPQKAGSAAGNTETTAVGKGKQQSVQERNDAAVAKAAALVKPAVSAEAEAKRQVRSHHTCDTTPRYRSV